MLRQYGKRLVGAVLSCCVILAGFTACSSDSAASSAGDNSDTAAGLAYLQSLDNITLSAVEDTLTWQHQHNLEEMHDELVQQLESGETSCWSLFEDYLMCGDSRFVGFSYDGFLPESNVWAESGKTISTLQEMVPDIVAQAPARLFVDYGMNDFCSGNWNEPDVWAQTYADIIRDLQTQLPNLTVYVCSIIPTTDALRAEDSLWTLIPDYNDALAEAFGNMEHVCYIDFTELGNENQDHYLYDGKHFDADFYEEWGKELILAEFDYEFDDGSGDSADADTASGTSTTTDADTAAAVDQDHTEALDQTAAGTEPNT